MSDTTNFIKSSPFVGRRKYLTQLDNYLNASDVSGIKFILVGGKAGVGKSTLVNTFLSKNLLDNDLVLYAKYEDNKSNEYHQGIVYALKHYAELILLEKESVRKELGNKISSLLGPNIKILQDLIPDFKSISANSENVQALPPLESSNRFNFVINELVKFIANQTNRLVFFLDDLHWASKDSIILLESILNNPSLTSTIIIGTYRTEEVGVSHILSTSVLKQIKSNKNVYRIDLPPFEKEDVIHFTNKLINHNSEELGEYLYNHSNGNPFFIKELIENIFSDNSININSENTLDLEKIKQLKVSTNVVDLLVVKFKRMSDDLKFLLKYASCLGSSFYSHTLAELKKSSVEDVDAILSEGITLGLIIDVSKKYKYYQFAHDRIQESAYDLIENKAKQHLEIGRILKKKSNNTNKMNLLTDATYHLNLGRELITDKKEIDELCSLNLNTALIYKASGAWENAVTNLLLARKLLFVDSWTNDHKHSYDIYKNLAESYYLAGNYIKAEELCNLTLERVNNRFERMEIFKLKVIQLTNLGRWAEALSEGLEGIKVFNFDLENYDKSNDVVKKINEFKMDKLKDLPVTQDITIESFMSLCNSMVSPVYVLKPELMRNLVLIMIQISLESGNTKESAYAYEMYGFMLGPVMGDYIKGHEFSKLALKLNETLQDSSLRCKIKLTYATNINPWINDIRSNFSILETAAAEGIRSGDLINSGYCYVSHLLQLFSSGENLDLILDVLDIKIQFLLQTNNPVLILAKIIKQVKLNLIGKTLDDFSFSDEKFDEELILEEMKKNGFLHGLHWYYVNKMLLSVINNKFENALNYVSASEEAAIGAVGQFSLADHNYYHSLILLGLLWNQDKKGKKLSKLIDKNQLQLNKWAKLCPINFQHKYSLIKAECAALEDRNENTKTLYEKAIELAKESGFIQDVAISLERYSRYHERLGNLDKAEQLKEESCKYYLDWGAIRKS